MFETRFATVSMIDLRFPSSGAVLVFNSSPVLAVRLPLTCTSLCVTGALVAHLL